MNTNQGEILDTPEILTTEDTKEHRGGPIAAGLNADC